MQASVFPPSCPIGRRLYPADVAKEKENIYYTVMEGS